MDEHQIQQRGQQWLEQFFSFATLPVQIYADGAKAASDDSYWLTIDSTNLTAEQIAILTGENGSVLDSIQYIINATLNIGQPPDQQHAYTIELNGYRVQRQQELLAMAEQAAQQVRTTGEESELTSLSSAERRQIHTFLKAFDDLETQSRGQEPDRRLVIRLINHSPE
ncbi:MAG: RNA-binding protein [Leptolyngbyaceae cyanobacterium SL_7_1]|nr:RNA-binding protein [Leptolyngbyaceae cyanobacterium SL_7_1]